MKQACAAWGIALAWALAAMPVAAAEAPPNKALAALFEREWQHQMEVSPEYATFVGDERYNDRLGDRTPERVQAEKVHARAVLAEFRRFPQAGLNAQDRVSLRLAIEDLQRQEEATALYGELPFIGLDGWHAVNAAEGPQFLFPALAKAAPFRNVRDYENYLKRLAAIPRALQQTREKLQAGLRSGWVPPAEVMTRVPGQFDAFTGADLAANPLDLPFQNFPVDMAEPERQRLQAAGRRLLAEQVQPAFAALRRYLVDEYIPGCRKSIAASALPGGPAYYALAVRENTTTAMTPQQVHELGLKEVARIGKAMDELVAQQGFTGGRAAFIEQMKADPRFYFTSPEDMLRAYRDIAKRVDAELPRLFATLPRLPYGIRAMEAYEGDAAEHYTSGSLDGSRAGWFEANVRSLKTRPMYEMENTLLHEAVPGHHLQTARAQEIEGLPKFRRAGWYVAYGEGWALYAESLGAELGVYKEPHSRLAAYQWEMLRACRLVVDTGMHSLGWSRDQALRYILDNAGIAEGFARSEVDRYVANPGQALGYKIGELKIRALRAKAQSALGERFDVRRFHNVILDDGPLPLTLLESRVDEWIAGEQRLAAQGSAGAKAR